MFGLSTSRTISNDQESVLKSLERTLNAIENALNWIHENHKNVNLDTIIGSRIVEGMNDKILTFTQLNSYVRRFEE